MNDMTKTSLYQIMLYIRRFEEIICEVYAEQEMRSPVHLSIGEEAVIAGVCANLKEEDRATSTHRNHGVCLARGVSPFKLYAECYGRAEGLCKGKGGSMHCASAENGIFLTSAIVGGGVPIGVGIALAAHMLKEERISAIFFGDGAFEEGSSAECLNFAALHKLPVLFVCTNNFYATVSHQLKRQPDMDIYKRALPYMPCELVDGTDVLAVSAAAKKAVNSIRCGGGPYFLEMRAYRFKEHVGPNEDWQHGARPKDELLAWKMRDPIILERARLMAEKALNGHEDAALLEEINKNLYSALHKAKAAPFPEPQDLFNDIFAE